MPGVEGAGILRMTGDARCPGSLHDALKTHVPPSVPPVGAAGGTGGLEAAFAPIPK